MPFDNVPVKKPLSPETKADLRAMHYARFGVETGGWCKCRYTDKQQNHCVLGWLREAAGPRRAALIASTYLVPLIHRSKSSKSSWWNMSLWWQASWVTAFNDHPDTTREDVLNLIDRAIARAEENVDAV